MLTQEHVADILKLADHYAQQRYRDSNYGTNDGFNDRKELVRYLERLMRPAGVSTGEFGGLLQEIDQAVAGVKGGDDAQA